MDREPAYDAACPRLVVGPLASREAVKNAYFRWKESRGVKTPVIAGNHVTGLADLAAELLGHAWRLTGQRPQPKPLTATERADALTVIASSGSRRGALPYLTHLKQRPFAVKVAGFLAEVDALAQNDDERDALLESIADGDPEQGQFLALLQNLWLQGQLFPWSGAHALREAVAHLQRGEAPAPRALYLWAFPPSASPLEERFLQALAERGCAVHRHDPASDISAAPAPVLRFWLPHSAFDEIARVKEDLMAFAAEHGAAPPWPTIALFTPAQAVYKRLLRQELMELNIPIQDPTLSRAWLDRPHWTWWRDLLRAAAGDMTRDQVTTLLGTVATDSEGLVARRRFHELCLKRGVDGGASSLKRLNEECHLPEIDVLLGTARRLSATLSLPAFQEALVGIARAAAADPRIPSADILLEFADELGGREYLQDFRGRLPRYLPLFEEYLEARGAKESQRCPSGLWMVNHGVQVPVTLARAYVLGAGAWARHEATADPLTVEAQVSRDDDRRRASQLWRSLNASFGEARARDAAFHSALASVAGARSLIVSEPGHDLSGKEAPRNPLALRALERLGVAADGTSAPPEFSGGHGAVGWTKGLGLDVSIPSVSAARHEEAVVALWRDKPLRISAFEDYLKCPFVFYSRHVLRLEEESHLTVDLVGKAKGNIIHKVCERVLREEMGGGALPGEKRLKEVLAEEMARTPLEGLHRDRPLRARAEATLQRSLSGWLAVEKERREKFPTLKPVALEVPLEFQLDDGFKLTGRADRIDSDGSAFVVIDYKSGSSSMRGGDLLEGHGAQLFMYAAAYRNATGQDPAGMFYFEVGRTTESSKGVYLQKYKGRLHMAKGANKGRFEGSFDDALGPVMARWEEAAAKLRRFDFSPKPQKAEQCGRCAMVNVCGYPRFGAEDEPS